MRPYILLLLLQVLATKTLATSLSYLTTTGACSNGFTLCAPADATSAITPQIGDAAFQSLFVYIVTSSLPPSKRSLNVNLNPNTNTNPLSTRAPASLCCNPLLSCLTITALSLPLCYDKFTTNFVLPDGSSGTIVTSSYTSPSGSSANLETGEFVLANGTTGNIYSNNEAAKPDTATLPMPSQFTASGIGSAVPISGLGGPLTAETFTTTVKSFVPPKTMMGSTVTAGVAVQTVVSGVGASGVTTLRSLSPSVSVVPATTLEGSTVSGVVTITTTLMQGVTTSSSLSPSPSATKQSDAGRKGREKAMLCLVGIVQFLAVGVLVRIL